MRRSALALLLGCLLLVAGASALDGYDYYQTIEYAACDQDIYQQDIVIHRSTGTAYNETTGGLETWHIYVGEHCREDYGDIRFTNSTGAELAYYLWPDFTSESARFAVRLEGADATGALTVWYGNPAATTTSDGDATYEFFDGFEHDISGSAPSKWSTSQGTASTVTVSADTAYTGSKSTLLRSTDATQGIASKEQAFPSISRVEYSALAMQTNSVLTGVYVDASTYEVNVAFWSDGLIKYNDGGTWKSTGKSYQNSVWYRYTLIIDNAAKEYRIIIPSLDIDISDISYRSGNAVNRLRMLTGAYATGDIYIDDVLVRAYSAAPPATTTFSGEHETAGPPATAFTANITAGLAPLTVQFTDTSAGRPTSWAWTFGDGGTSTAQNPQHTYAAPGTYSVNLTATNEHGSDYELKADYITVYGPITAQFSATPTGGTAPLTVQFTDRSTGGPTSWLWDFGDGNTSTAQNPAHTYTTAGTHTVTLTASHPYDSDTETKTSYITVAVLQPFPGLTNIPRDLDNNGHYTDINGNGRLDYNDLTVFFQNLAWAKTAQPIACFDFNGNGWLDYNDVITLFSTIMEEHT